MDEILELRTDHMIIKVKFTLEQVIMAQGGSRGIALLFL
jgi:hypothetical protein